MVTLSKETYKR